MSLAADGDKSAALLLSGLDDQDDEEEEEEKKDIRVFSSIHTPAERNEMLEVDWQRRTANNSSSKRVSKMDRLDGQAKTNRNKRQADLSSHTQDGVPIFDRGYGATPPNRTEGLRIYQSLLTNSGRNEPGQSRSAESDAAVVQQQQPHHRQNNFWRNRNKEKPRHRHQKATTRSPAMVDDVELSSVAAEFEANGQDLRSPSDTTSAPPAASAKSSVAPSNVEFRHSRVKTSSENTGPLSVDQKIWSRSNGIFSIGAGPYAGGSLQEDRISAATAPAILTKTVTASVGSSSSQVRQQQQPNVYKVNQPAVNARGGSSQQSDNEDQISRDSPSSPSSSGKKRINKKQLRDLSHTATAVHLVADTRNATSTSYENQGSKNTHDMNLASYTILRKRKKTCE